MSIVQLRTCRALSLEYKGILTPGERITLQNKCSYSVRYAKENVCVSTLQCKVSDKEHEDKFYVNIDLEGVFSYDPSVTREEIHVATFKELFPYARSIVTSVTAVCGVTPVLIPQIDIEGQSIFRIDPENIKG